MTKRKFKFAKVVWLILLCVGIAIISTDNSEATTMSIVVDDIDYDTSVSGVGYYTRYWLETNMGRLDAFCVENADALPVQQYELYKPIPSDFNTAARIASRYYDGSVLSQIDIINDELQAKVSTQLAIWVNLGIISQNSIKDDDYLSRVVAILDSANFNLGSISESIWLARSPIGGAPGAGQDYLVSVPDASIMFLLGSALLGLGLFGRKRKSDV